MIVDLRHRKKRKTPRRSAVESYIRNADLDLMGDISLSAIESATVDAINESIVASSGGSVFAAGPNGESGKSLAVNGVIVTNLVQSQANAYVVDSDLQVAGAVTINSQNIAEIDALVVFK